ncbi:cytoskeleton-associated 5 isoform X2 [Brachionus plicatilis]|uniref:Cytoskeleton-associated 5 isoform X2 n=1 Tax=Brachionus plicatilis TaxID=10195 RepID=A0A3M7RIC9_BRAPC|nr:cytoskeleton-associated 5 isoform X2 [Brachionus plicatilis]
MPKCYRYTKFLTNLNQLNHVIRPKRSSNNKQPKEDKSSEIHQDYEELLSGLTKTLNQKTDEEPTTVPQVYFVPVKTKGILKKTDSSTSTGKSRKSIVINTAKNQLRFYEPEYRNLYFKDKKNYEPKAPEFYNKVPSEPAKHQQQKIDNRIPTQQTDQENIQNDQSVQENIQNDQIVQENIQNDQNVPNYIQKNDPVFADSSLETERLESEENKLAFQSETVDNPNLNEDNFKKLLEILAMQVKIQTESRKKKHLIVFSTFFDEIMVLNVLKQAVIQHPIESINNLDTIFNWIWIRIQDINPYYVYKLLDYLYTLFKLLITNELKITHHQANLIIPCLIENFSDSRPYIQPAISILLKQMSICYDDRKIFKHLMDFIKTSNDTIRIQCLEEVSFLLNTFFMESYQPETSMNEIACLIDDKNRTIASSAMTIIAVCFIKYGNDAFDYVNNYDYIPMIKRHLNANYEHINDLARQKFSLDAQIPLVFKYVIHKCKTIDEEVQYFGKREYIKHYVDSVNGRIVENCVNALLNLDLFLHEQQFSLLEDYADDLVKNCSIAMNKVLIEYSTNKDSLILNDLIYIVFTTVSHLFAKGLGRMVSVGNLRMFMFSLVIGKKIMSKRDEKWEMVDQIFKKVTMFADETSCLIALFRVLDESLKKENSLLEFSNYVVKIILFRLKGIEFGQIDGKTDEKLETLNLELVQKLDAALVLGEIHEFLENNPTLNTDLTAGCIEENKKKKRIISDIVLKDKKKSKIIICPIEKVEFISFKKIKSNNFVNEFFVLIACNYLCENKRIFNNATLIKISKRIENLKKFQNFIQSHSLRIRITQEII